MSNNSATYNQKNWSQVSKNLEENYEDKYIKSPFASINFCVNNSNIDENNCNIVEDASDLCVNVLDSESSELFMKSLNSQNNFKLNNTSCIQTDIHLKNNFDKKMENCGNKEEIQTKKFGSQVETVNKKCLNKTNKVENKNENNYEISQESNNANIDTKNIIYRNKTKNFTTSPGAPKKRVSFHEDILKNPRTDNIHIEHGFITYKNQRKGNDLLGRHSWCSNVDTNKSNREEHSTRKCNDCEKKSKITAFRNAYSNVLDYGNDNIYENLESFEVEATDLSISDREHKILHSSSNPSLNSEENLNDIKQFSFNKKKPEYTKSSSCDCIGLTRSYFISKYCYFSEPSIDEPLCKSVWVKEKKPKYSCLKKTSQKNGFQVDEYDMSKKMQKFNVHELKIFDKSKMILGTFRDIFTINFPERGIPENANVPLVCEYALESESGSRNNSSSTISRLKNLSKSLDGEKHSIVNMGSQNKFIHNVDEQLRKKEFNLYEQTCDSNNLYEPQNRVENFDIENLKAKQEKMKIAIKEKANPKDLDKKYRNKYIINCVSTVFEHTGVSFIDEEKVDEEKPAKFASTGEASALMDLTSLKHAFTDMLKIIKGSAILPTSTEKDEKPSQIATVPKFSQKNSVRVNSKSEYKSENIIHNFSNKNKRAVLRSPSKNRNYDSYSLKHKQTSDQNYNLQLKTNSTKFGYQPEKPIPVKNFNHLNTISIPFKNNIFPVFNDGSMRMSPDLFDCIRYDEKSLSLVLIKDKIDDQLKINSNSIDNNLNNMITLRYPDIKKENKSHRTEFSSNAICLSLSSFLKASQSVLLNRFLQNVTKGKFMESSIRENRVFVNKIKEGKTFTGSLYIKRAKPLNQQLIKDLNAKIEMEIETSAVSFNYDKIVSISKNGYCKTLLDITHFQLGIGEIPAKIFNESGIHLLNNENENLMKVFKLYAGYSREGLMTPVLVFLTDKALYVRDLVENRLCNKYTLKYSELDIILIEPNGNSVLLSNLSRDKQEVLLAGEPQTAEGLVANLELCTRQGGFFLPAISQLTFENYGSLKTFIRQNLFSSSCDNWVYYAVITSLAESLATNKQPPTVNLKGFLMHRRVQKNCNFKKNTWGTGFFLLRSGTLQMFNDSNQKLPIWIVDLSQCEGARRTEKTGRPHCFEIALKDEFLQLAAPDDYILSEWLQALMQVNRSPCDTIKKQQILGCTLIMTTNYLVTLRENFKTSLNFENIKTSESNVCHTEDFPASTHNNNCLCSISLKNSTLKKYIVVNPRLISLKEIKSGNVYEKENLSSFYSKNAGIEILTCAFIKEMTGVRIPSKFESWWCILEFSCQEAAETLNDLIIFFSSASEMERFLKVLEQLWQKNNINLFPLTKLNEEDVISKQCTNIFIDISKSWIPLLTAAIAYPA